MIKSKQHTTEPVHFALQKRQNPKILLFALTRKFLPLVMYSLCLLFLSYFLRYKQHKTDFETIPQQRPINLLCQVPGCQCQAYCYIPLNGTRPLRCRCKHFSDQHSAAPGSACNACEFHGFQFIHRTYFSLLNS